MSKRQEMINDLTSNQLIQGFAEVIADLPFGEFDDEIPTHQKKFSELTFWLSSENFIQLMVTNEFIKSLGLKAEIMRLNQPNFNCELDLTGRGLLFEGRKVTRLNWD